MIQNIIGIILIIIYMSTSHLIQLQCQPNWIKCGLIGDYHTYISISPHNKYISIAQYKNYLIDLENGSLKKRIYLYSILSTFSNNDEELIFLNNDIKKYNLSQNKKIDSMSFINNNKNLILPDYYGYYQLAFSDDNSKIILYGKWEDSIDYNIYLTLWVINNKKLLKTIYGSKDQLISFTVSDDYKYIAYSENDGNITVRLKD